jgi:hypothetical protein
MTILSPVYQSFDGRMHPDRCRAEHFNQAMLTCLRIGHDPDQSGRCKRCLLMTSKGTT